MTTTLQRLVLPAFLLLCLIFGGSSQSVCGVLFLRLAAIAIISWALISRGCNVRRQGRGLLVLLLAALLLIAVQLVPLPPSAWVELPGRTDVEAGYRALSQPLPWLPLSLTPYATLECFLSLLPPAAVILAVLRLDACSPSWTVLALMTGTIAGTLLGYLQLVTGHSGASSWYLYDQTNVGSAVGFFANRNHMGTLLLMAFPFVVTLFFRSNADDSRRTNSLKVIGLATLVVIVLGIAVNGSLAAVALVVPVILGSALLVSSSRRFSGSLTAAALIALLGAMIFLANSPVQPKVTGESTSSFEGRWDIWKHTWSAVETSFPAGTGLGSFQSVYGAEEPSENVTPVYVNHAHNDYLETVLEAGLPGALLIVVFFGWWFRRVVEIASSPFRDRYAAAAVIASGAALAHSVADYPLRTSAIATVFAFAVALMAGGSGQVYEPELPRLADGRRGRHVRIG